MQVDLPGSTLTGDPVEVELPLGLELDVRLPDGSWQPGPVPAALQLTGQEAGLARLVALGEGVASLRWTSGEQSVELVVTVTPPLMGD